jgi:hypothetical protein
MNDGNGSKVSVHQCPQLGSENFKLNQVKANAKYYYLDKVLGHTA